MDHEAIAKAYGCKFRACTKYHYQVRPDESDNVYNWYPTQGKWTWQKVGEYSGAVKGGSLLPDFEDFLIAVQNHYKGE